MSSESYTGTGSVGLLIYDSNLIEKNGKKPLNIDNINTVNTSTVINFKCDLSKDLK